jgi:hypothetical protein
MLTILTKKTSLILTFLILSTALFPFNITHIGHAQSNSEWSTPVNLSVSGIAAEPVTVVDYKGTLHVIWVDEVDGYRYTNSRDGGLSWSPPVPLTIPVDPKKDQSPVLLADKKGLIHVFWLSIEEGEMNYAQVPADNFGDASRWAATRLNDGVSNFDVTIDSRGYLHLAYIENVTSIEGFAGVYYSQSQLSGNAWSSPVNLYRSEYFRATDQSNSYIRISVSETAPEKGIFVSWDNRPEKRIFFASSTTDGKTWESALQFKGPEDYGLAGSPFNLSIWVNGNDLLLMWQVGEPGASKCSVFSQSSKDAGKTFGAILTLFGGPTACPTGIKFAFAQAGQVVALLSGSGDPVMIAWDGSRWSEPQVQTRLPALANPNTFDAILLGCRQDIISNDQLFVVGCDEAKGGDIWFLVRSLPPVDAWFTSPTFWEDPAILEAEAQPVTEMVSVTDTAGNVHSLWVEIPVDQADGKPYIQYSRWDGTAWSVPETVIRNLDTKPIQLSLYLDVQERLMLAWVDGKRGDLLFTWSNLKQAGLSSGWETATVLPTPSQLVGSPDIIADASGKIVVAYAVLKNENRGIYLVQSTDNAVTWSPFIQAFDGVANQWEFVDAPKLALTGDGALHLLLTRRSTWESDPFGLYYSRSLDGGASWSDVQFVTEARVQWSELVSYGDRTIHRLWQEDNGLVVANLSQVSEDGGEDWGRTLDITGVSDRPSQIAVAHPGSEQIYFVQLLQTEETAIPGQVKLGVQASVWNGSVWLPDIIKELNVRSASGSEISLNGYLGVLMSTSSFAQKGETQPQVLAFGRFIDGLQVMGGSTSAVLPDVIFNDNAPIGSTPVAIDTPFVDPAILYDSNNPSEGITRNLVGVSLIVGVVIVSFILMFMRRPARKRPGND